MSAPPPPAPPVQLWKVSDARANKRGECGSVYWVKDAPPSSSALRSLPTVPSSTLRSKRRYATSERYKGDWLDNQRHGYGSLTRQDRSVYEGHFEHNRRHGEGALFIASPLPPHTLTRVYAGQWAADAKHGVGTYHYKDGSRYEGQWQHNQRHGQGTLFAPNGDTYTGGWDRGQQSGFGSLVKGEAVAATSGDVYEGGYVRGRREGQGMYYYRQRQQIFDGDWVNDQPVTGIIMDAHEFFQQQQQQGGGGRGSGGGGQADTAAPSPQTSRPGTEGGGKGFTLSRPSSAAMLGVARSLLGGDGGQPLPRLRLADPDAVLSSQLSHLSLIRAPLRALTRLPPLASLYPSHTLQALRGVWERHVGLAQGGRLHPVETGLLGVKGVEDGGVVRDGWGVVGRRGVVRGEEVRRVLRELGKRVEGEAGWVGGGVEGERDGEGEVEGEADVSYATFVYALYLLEQGRVVAQAVAEEERRDKERGGEGGGVGKVEEGGRRGWGEEEKEQLGGEGEEEGEAEGGAMSVQVEAALEVEAAPEVEMAPAVVFAGEAVAAVVE